MSHTWAWDFFHFGWGGGQYFWGNFRILYCSIFITKYFWKKLGWSPWGVDFQKGVRQSKRGVDHPCPGMNYAEVFHTCTPSVFHMIQCQFYELLPQFWISKFYHANINIISYIIFIQKSTFFICIILRMFSPVININSYLWFCSTRSEYLRFSCKKVPP